MSNLYVYTLFDKKTKLPRCTGIKDGDKVVIVDLYRPGESKSIQTIFKHIKTIRKLILASSKQGRPVVLSDFKSHIKAFDLPRDSDVCYSVYDLHLPDITPTDSSQKDHALIRKILSKISIVPIREYQHILANAGVVYQDLEDHGLKVYHTTRNPIWSQKTFSGRSKTLGFNIQGYSEQDKIRTVSMPDNSILIHFDWVCADIRVASLLSQDRNLQKAFDLSDPYVVMMNELNEGSTDKLTRDECKTYLLKSINSMDFTSAALSSVYPELGEWIRRCKRILAKENPQDQYLETLLKRRFKKANAKNDLAVLNGVMQGSVAHAMQLSMRRIWEKCPQFLIAEIHDSLVISCYPTARHVASTINTVSEIMLHPFKGVLDTNPAFPLKVSVGKRWKEWQTMRIYRENGITHVKTKQNKSQSNGQAEDSGTEAKEKETS